MIVLYSSQECEFRTYLCKQKDCLSRFKYVLRKVITIFKYIVKHLIFFKRKPIKIYFRFSHLSVNSKLNKQMKILCYSQVKSKYLQMLDFDLFKVSRVQDSSTVFVSLCLCLNSKRKYRKRKHMKCQKSSNI